MNPDEEEKQNSNNEEEEDEEEEESEESTQVNTLTIKKESLSTITIDKKIYNKLLTFLEDTIATNVKLRNKINKITLNEENQTDDSLLMDPETKKKLENTITISNDKLREFENNIKKLTEENNKLKKDNEQFQSKIKEIEEKNKKDISLLTKELEQFKEQNKLLTSENKKLKSQLDTKLIKNKTFDTISTHPKLLVSITQFLRSDDKISLARTSRSMWLEIFYRAKSEVIQKKLIEKESIVNILTKTDTAEKFDVAQEEVNALLSEYMTNNRISGIEIRNDIVRALGFLEKCVKIPLKNFKGPEEDEAQHPQDTKSKLLHFRPGGKREKIFNKLNSMISIIKGDEDEFAPTPFVVAQGENGPIVSNVHVLSFKDDEFKNLFSADMHILETFNTDKSINVNFEYKKSDNIKDLLSEFFKSGLPKTTYQNFLVKICEVFSDLLYSCYLALRDIKNLEIVKHALYCRFMKYRERSAEMEIEIRDMNQFAKSSKEVKEMLLKQKNEVEIKYNNSLMIIAQLNDEKVENDKKIGELNEKMKKNAEKYELFKTQIIKEYKNIQSDFSLTKKERDLLKSTLIDFKNYFMKFIGDDGELIE